MPHTVPAIRVELLAAYAEASASMPFAPAALRRLVDLLVEGFDALAQHSETMPLRFVQREGRFILQAQADDETWHDVPAIADEQPQG